MAAISIEKAMSYGLSERYAKILHMRESGATYREIAEKAGCSQGVARQIVIKATNQVFRAREYGAFVGLSERTKNMLRGFNLKSKEDVVKAVNEGWLSPTMEGLPNYGPKTHKEVCAWASITDPVR